MHVACLTRRYQHHTASGGYDRLAREVAATVVQRIEGSRFWRHVFWRLSHLRSPTNLYLLDYSYEDFVAELNLLAKSRLRKPNVVHALYGDEQLDLLLRVRSLLPCPLVASFHLPTSCVAERFKRLHKHLVAGIDAAVVVSRCQLKDFRVRLGRDKVVYVPHGVDTQKFCPGGRNLQRRRIQLIIVGEHMRDWEASHRIIDECNARNLPVEFDAVLRRAHWPAFIGCANTRLHTGLPEEELIMLYQNADALLVPVVDATANNTVLESLACGTPVISNSVGGIPDYVDVTCGWLFAKGEVLGIVELINQLCNKPELAWSLRESARRKSLEFSWERIAEQMMTIYKAVANGSSPADAVAAWEQSSRIPLSSLSA
jgi:glycosyltransferase involved in cell wall biosynthesis